MVHHSGIGTYLRNLLPYLLVDDRFRFTLLGDPEVLAALDLPPAEVRPMSSDIYTIREQLELARKVPRCDLVWSPHYNVPALPTRARRRIVTVHDVNHLAFLGTLSKPKQLYAKAMINTAVRGADRVITDSEFSKSEILKYIDADPGKIHVIYVGADTSFTEGITRSEAPRPYVLHVGVVKPHKNIGSALLGFEKIMDEVDADFLVVGPKEGMLSVDDSLAAVAERLGDRVRFTGKVPFDELRQAYADAALLVMPSTYEGFGLPVLEAMQFDIPVICSNAASLPEVGGDAVDYFEPFDTDRIAQLMKDHLTGAIRHSGEKYRDQLSVFDWDRSVVAHTDLFLDVLSAQRS